MERFRDLIIHCENEDAARQLMQKIKQTCDAPPFQLDKQNTNPYPYKDDNVVRIISTFPNTPEAVLILSFTGLEIKVNNILPFKDQLSCIEESEYNTILAAFKGNVMDKFIDGDKVDFSPDESSMKLLIPKSYHEFVSWFRQYSASYSQFRFNYSYPWFGFISTLVKNKEQNNLSSDDLKQWLEENNWGEKQIAEAIQHYSHDVLLIEYQINELLSKTQRKSSTKTKESTKGEKEKVFISYKADDEAFSRAKTYLTLLQNEFECLSDDLGLKSYPGVPLLMTSNPPEQKLVYCIPSPNFLNKYPVGRYEEGGLDSVKECNAIAELQIALKHVNKALEIEKTIHKKDSLKMVTPLYNIINQLKAVIGDSSGDNNYFIVSEHFDDDFEEVK